MTLRALLGDEGIAVAAVEAHLDGLDPAERLAETRALGRRDLRRLFDRARGHRALCLEDLVPAPTPPMHGVFHHGRNSLPAFRRFAKVFCRPDGPERDREVWGYNHGSALVATLVGPGYFVAYAIEDGELLVDYLRVPPRKPADWPRILSNSARLSRLVYHGTQDVLRGVSRHVTIGRARRAGRDMNAWFVLCREA